MATALRDLVRALPDTTLRTEIQSLSQETDPTLLREGLLQVAKRQETGEHPEIAVELYNLLSQAGGLEANSAAPISRLARERLQALRGEGSFGNRFEILARNFARQASDPAMLGAMALGGAVFQTTRLAVLSRLAASPTASLLTRGLGARALAWSAGFALEFPTFTFAARGLHQATGASQDWSREAVARDLLSSGLTLFMLKGAGATGNSLVGRIQNGAAAEGAFLRFSQAAIPQAAAFTGIFASHVIESQFGLRPRSNAASMLFDSLATLLQFHVGARLLHHAGFDGYEQQLDLLNRRLQDSGLVGPRSGGFGTSPIEALRPAMASTEEPTMIGPLTVLMSGPRRLPSDRPGPMPAGDDSGTGRILAHPTQLRDLRQEIDDLDRVLNDVYRSETNPQTWREEVATTLRALRAIIGDLHERIGQEEERRPLLPYLRELAIEYRTAENLLERSLASHEAPPAVESLEPNRFLQYLIRSTNTLINFINDSALIQMPLENARLARSWLQRGLEEETAIDSTPTHPHFPYTRLPTGNFVILGEKQLVLVTGDENGARTFPLAEAGHRVLHLNPNKSELSTTQRRLHYQTERRKSSGEWKLDPVVEFHANDDSIPRVNLMEAYFPAEFSDLPPRSSADRTEALSNYLENFVLRRLAPGGSAFILSDSDTATEDLANIALRTPGTEVLEVFYRRSHLPLIGGKAATIERGEALVSWMVLRRFTEEGARP